MHATSCHTVSCRRHAVHPASPRSRSPHSSTLCLQNSTHPCLRSHLACACPMRTLMGTHPCSKPFLCFHLACAPLLCAAQVLFANFKTLETFAISRNTLQEVRLSELAAGGRHGGSRGPHGAQLPPKPLRPWCCCVQQPYSTCLQAGMLACWHVAQHSPLPGMQQQLPSTRPSLVVAVTQAPARSSQRPSPLQQISSWPRRATM